MNIKRLFLHGSWVLMTVIAVVLTACQTEEPTFAEQVLRNGRILTVDNQFSVAEALAIQGERIVEVGSNDDIEDQVGPDTRVIDLEGRTVIPGLIDNHMHFIRAVQRWNLQARIDGVDSKDEALANIAAKAASMEPGEWLMVQGGWRENQFVGGPSGFSLEELDAAAPENPLFLQITYQSVYANSLALEAVGVSPDEGAYHRGPPLISGQPPYGLLNEQMPAVSQEQLEQNLFDFIHELNRVGLTSVYDVGRPPEGDISLLERMSAEGDRCRCESGIPSSTRLTTRRGPMRRSRWCETAPRVMVITWGCSGWENISICRCLTTPVPRSAIPTRSSTNS